MTEVVAALLWEGDRFLICQRPAHKTRGLLWEFVGGKVEPGETKEQALRRECREELGIEIGVEDVFMEVLHTYPDMQVHLTLFNSRIQRGAPQLLELLEGFAAVDGRFPQTQQIDIGPVDDKQFHFNTSKICWMVFSKGPLLSTTASAKRA